MNKFVSAPGMAGVTATGAEDEDEEDADGDTAPRGL